LSISTAISLLAGFVFLIGGAEVLVRGASRLALTLGVSPLVVGLTIVAYGTSAPEIAVSVASSIAGTPDLLLGNVVGSNICNVLLVLGLSATVTPIVVARRLVRLEVPLVIAVSVLVIALASTGGRIARLESVLLFVLAAAYTLFAVVQGRRERAPDPESFAGSDRGRAARSVVFQVSLVVIGLGGLVVGSDWLVDGATEIARGLGVSEMVIGLTVVAIGTSLPEVATSLVAALRGERDLAVGNVLGSNLMNLLAVLGVAGLVGTGPIPVAQTAMRFDLWVMLATALLCLPVFWTGGRIERWEGALLLVYYLMYLSLLVHTAREPERLAGYLPAMLAGAGVLLALVVGTSAARRMRKRRVEPG
jgi:cation:H+ antiporter